MVKITKITIDKISFILLLGCLGLSSRLYGAQAQHTFVYHQNMADSLSSLSHSPEDDEDTSSSDSEAPYAFQYCRSIKECKAFAIIMGCLRYWQRVNNTDGLHNIFGYLSKLNNYKDIINAYHHLLAQHLSTSNHKAVYNYIHQKTTHALCCSFTTCTSYARNQRKRAKAVYQVDEDREYVFLRDLLDTIHAYLVHGVDSGHRYIAHPENKKLYKIYRRPKDDTSSEDEQKEKNPMAELFDSTLKKLKQWQKEIKKTKRTQDKSSKFQTNMGTEKGRPTLIGLKTLAEKFGGETTFQIWQAYLLQNDCDTDCILEEIAVADQKETCIFFNKQLFSKVKHYIQEKKTKSEKIDPYGVGIRLYYWSTYQKSNQQDYWQPTYKEKELYVPPAFLSLKGEILDKKDVTMSAWHQKFFEADILLRQSHPLKKVTAGGLRHRYEIKKDSGLSMSHIVSVLFYTNFTYLCADFRDSFRYLATSEHLQDVVRRNSKWHYLSKYLREVVEIFGEMIHEQGSFYHGVSYLLFPYFNVHVYAPLSTSKQLEVPLLFTHKQGLIIELKHGPGAVDGGLRCFNASLISCFAAEDERLFIGGRYPMQILSVRLLRNHINTQPLMHTLLVIHQMIRGGQFRGNNKASHADIAILRKLLSSDDLPFYVQQIWKVFKHKQKEVTIDIWKMYDYYAPCLSLLSSPSIKNLLLFDQLVQIFPNATQITCLETDRNSSIYRDYSSAIVDASFLAGLQEQLRNIPKHAKLKKITISTVWNPIECELYAPQFRLLGWQIQKEKRWGVYKKIRLTKLKR